MINCILPKQPAPVNEILAAALDLAKRGVACFPMTNAKTPLKGSHGVRDASTDPRRLAELFADRRAELVAVATGQPSNISVLDIDAQHNGLVWWQENWRRLPPTFTYKSRSGGLHLWFRHHPDLRTIPIGAIGAGIEARSTGASAVYWPATGLPILSGAPPADWPSWLMPPPRPAWTPPPAPAWAGDDRKARAYATAALRKAIEKVAGAGSGARNSTLNSETYGLMRLVPTGAITPAEICEAMAHAGLAAGLDRAEVQATLRSVLQARGGR
jgi:hypothetical protein